MKKRMMAIVLSVLLAVCLFPAEVFAAQDTEVDLIAEDEAGPLHSYTDLVGAEEYHDGVHYCVEKGLMQGVAADRFAPDLENTRAQFMVSLWHLEGDPLVPVAEDFHDVFDFDWYNDAVRWGSANRIAEGYGESIYGPNDNITREQMATILWRYCKHKGYDVSVGEDTNILSYADAFDVSDWAMEAVQWACGTGLIRGVEKDGDMFLEPRGSVSRGESAVMIYRLCAEIIDVSANTVRPLPDTTMENLTDAILAVSLEEGDAYVDDTGKMQMDVKIYTYDVYDAKAISELKVGDIIVTHAGEVTVNSLERGENGSVCINGGLEEGGFDLVSDGGGTFIEIGFNDVKNWYEVGEATIRVSVDFMGYDNADPEQGEVILYPGDFLIGAVENYDFTPHNTTIRVEGGQIVEMNRSYTP